MRRVDDGEGMWMMRERGVRGRGIGVAGGRARVRFGLHAGKK